MTLKALDLLVKIVESLTKHAHESALELAAMEAMLKRRPELRQEYEKELQELSASPASVANRQGMSELLATLRTEFLRDRDPSVH